MVVFEIDPDSKYSRLILSVDDPVGWERKINNAVGNPTPGSLAFRAQQRVRLFSLTVQTRKNRRTAVRASMFL